MCLFDDGEVTFFLKTDLHERAPYLLIQVADTRVGHEVCEHVLVGPGSQREQINPSLVRQTWVAPRFCVATHKCFLRAGVYLGLEKGSQVTQIM